MERWDRATKLCFKRGSFGRHNDVSNLHRHIGTHLCKSREYFDTGTGTRRFIMNSSTIQSNKYCHPYLYKDQSIHTHYIQSIKEFYSGVLLDRLVSISPRGRFALK
jgi:hypothetical protein